MMRILIFFLLSIFQSSVIAETLAGRVVRVTDGDTLVVLDASKVQQKIRLQGIDAPERGQAFGAKSKEHLSDLVAGKHVVVEYGKLDRYERVLGKVLLGDKDVNLGQVEAGMAWHYKKYQDEQSSSDRIKYSDAEFEARRDKRGLWHEANPTAPWDYRKAKREQRKAMEAFEIKTMTRDAPY